VASVQHRARVVVVERLTQDCNSPGGTGCGERSAGLKAAKMASRESFRWSGAVW
jgi:hypothetical protein